MYNSGRWIRCCIGLPSTVSGSTKAISIITIRSTARAAPDALSTAPGYSLGQAVEAIRAIEQEEHLPVSVVTGFQGNAKAYSVFRPQASGTVLASGCNQGNGVLSSSRP